MLDLFRFYPELTERIEGLCGGASWGVTGVSALVHDDDDALYFEITKPKHWQRRQEGVLVGGIGGLGGSIEPGETVLACLYRETEEELGAPVAIESAARTDLVYEQNVADALALDQRSQTWRSHEYPAPALCTISENLYPQARHSQCQILVIVTFWARLLGTPSPDDLFGLLVIPREELASVFRPQETALSRLRTIRGVRVVAHEPLPEDMLLKPVWTARSLQLLLEAGWVPSGESRRRS